MVTALGAATSTAWATTTPVEGVLGAGGARWSPTTTAPSAAMDARTRASSMSRRAARRETRVRSSVVLRPVIFAIPSLGSHVSQGTVAHARAATTARAAKPLV